MTAPRPLASTAQLREQKLTVLEVAKILRVSKMSVYRLCESKALRSYRVGAAYELEGEEE